VPQLGRIWSTNAYWADNTAMGAIRNRDPYNLERFLAAQEAVIERARSELRAGRKQSHWMWFIFPQIHGLGCSSMARYYAI
jgi:uncharacterized protein (DUF1810 family)